MRQTSANETKNKEEGGEGGEGGRESVWTAPLMPRLDSTRMNEDYNSWVDIKKKYHALLSI